MLGGEVLETHVICIMFVLVMLSDVLNEHELTLLILMRVILFLSDLLQDEIHMMQ